MPTPVRDPIAAEDLHYPEHLPVVARKDDIAQALRDHQVVVVAGETGSGKTTQLPKIALEIGRGTTGQIGHTQPRRIAARSVAERIAEEMQVELGELIGYQVRFADHSSDSTAVKVMTDGILLNELQRDRDLRRYDTIIIDEAHERSLNIDFILGYLKQLLPRRPDLKVIITSATIDPERFAAHFGGPDGEPAPIIEVSGRTYPVEVRYRPLGEQGEDDADQGEGDQVTGICRAVEELWTEPHVDGPRDALVFLSGEREIRDAQEALTSMDLPDTEVIPLYARLSAAEQHRVFAPHRGRRIVLATNVAETSLTVPGIRYVIDVGTARISRYSQRTKVQRLPIERVSQASANQRAGRCGRIAEGVCIRLYSEEDFESRPEFTDPEILRTNLASVILQMTSLGLGDVGRFPFVEPPDPRQVTDGVRLLQELQAFDTEGAATGAKGGKRGGRRLTPTGRALARLPVDPRLGRMLIEADRLGCTTEVLVIVAAMSIQDPRERPADQRSQADQQHARFRQEGSDFAAWWNLWVYLKDQRKALSGSAFRRMCKREYIHFLRTREWQDLHSQLVRAAKQQKIDTRQRTAAHGAEPDWDTIHKALLTGLLSHIGLRDEDKRDYLGARGARFSIQPGTTNFRRQPPFVMAGELVETSRLWARSSARIDPVWAERAGAHLIKRTYSEPRWSKRAASVLATERVTLFGVPLVVGRPVSYGKIDPVVSRDLFIRHALVEGEWDGRHDFLSANRKLIRRLEQLEERARRRDLLVDEEDIVAFYDERIPADVVSGAHFDTWWKQARRDRPELLTLTEELLTREDAEAVSGRDYPRRWRTDGLELAVSYQFEPGTEDDGVTVHVPVAVLNQLTPGGFDWQVPGLRGELVAALIRSLPKATRRHLVPAPDHARAALAELDPDAGTSITAQLSRVLGRRAGLRIDEGEWDWSRVPDHLRITFAVEDQRRRRLGRGKDLAALAEELAGHVQQRMSRAGSSMERTGLRTWDVDDLPETFTTTAGKHTVVGYPALVDEGESVGLRVLPDEQQASAAHRDGVRRLLLLGTTPPWKRVLARLTNAQKLALAENPHGSVPALLEDALAAAVDDIVAQLVPGSVRTRAAFDEALAATRTHVAQRVLTIVAEVEPVLAQRTEILRLLDRMSAPALSVTVADVRAQLNGLVRPGFIAETGAQRLPDLRRYLRGISLRLERAAENPRRDAGHQEAVDSVESAYADLLDALPPLRRRAEDVVAIGWMIEELRVSLFAQSLGTAYSVSAKRVRAAIAAVPTD